MENFLKWAPPLQSIYRYKKTFGRMPNIIRPRTFNEKILRKILFDRNPKLRLFHDKYLVRDFVISRLGHKVCITKLYGVVNSALEIRGLALPPCFVMKPNHLSGGIKIVRDFKNESISELENLAALWLKQNYYYTWNEWAYKHIRPRIIFEELLEVNGKIPDDWKFFCFGGTPRFLQIHTDRFTQRKCTTYDLNLSLIPVNLKHEAPARRQVPANFDIMVEIARKLSEGTDFLRVDLYNVQGRIVVGELTNYPGAGLDKFEPASWDLIFGSYWT